MTTHTIRAQVALWLIVMSAAGTIAAAESPLVRLNFDGDVSGQLASGEKAQALQADHVDFAGGVLGQALLADGNIVLRYPRNLLPVSRGTICFWAQPRVPVDQGGWRFFFSDGAGWGPRGMPRIWLDGAGRIRCDIDGGRRYFNLPAYDWPVEQWRHLAFTWDADAGVTQLFVDGKRAGGWNTPEPWTADATDSFRIGSGLDTANGNHAARAAIDEVAILDHVLDVKEINAERARARRPTLALRRQETNLAAGSADANFNLVNEGFGNAERTLEWRDAAGEHSERLQLAPGQSHPIAARLPGGFSGLYEFSLKVCDGASVTDNQTLRAAVYVERAQPTAGSSGTPWKLVRDIDCAATDPDAAFGPCQVIDSPIGKYREAGNAMNDRFAYIAKLSGANRLVRVKLTYPDDKVRTAGVSNWGPMQEALGSGYSCGDLTPITHQMQTREFVFHVRDAQEVAIVISTEGGKQPAAAARLVFEEACPPLAPAAPAPVLGAANHRRIGLYYEDPVLARSFDYPDTLDPAIFDGIINDAFDYCDWIGLNALSYPAVWYNGPIYYSAVCAGYPRADRFHPPDFLEQLARRCDERGFAYYPSLNTWRLAPLIPHLLDSSDVIAGKPNVNCVDRTGRVIPVLQMMNPAANALHPIVQQSVIEIVREIATRLKDHESFGGIDFMLWPGCLLSLQGGTGTPREVSYDDFTIAEFARQIAQTAPGAAGQADRFARRYQWIQDDPKRRAAWTDFRCQRIAEFYGRCADELSAIKPSAKLGVAIYDPGPSPRFDGADIGQHLRDSGIDVERISKHPNIVVRRFVHQMSERYALRNDRPRASDPNFVNSRAFNAPFAPLLGHAGVILHQQYFETPVGTGTSLPGLGGEAKAAAWNYGLRVTEPLPSGRDALRYYASAVRNFDPGELVVGGYVLGTQGIEAELRQFARAFAALPLVKFEDVSETADGVLVRHAASEQHHWWYAINISARAADAQLDLSAFPGVRVADAVSGRTIDAGANLVTLTLQPYELRVLRSVASNPESQKERNENAD